MGRYWNPGLIENGRFVTLRDRPYGPDLFTDFLVEFMRSKKDQPFLAYYPMVLIHTPWERTPDPSGRRKRLRPAAAVVSLTSVCPKPCRYSVSRAFRLTSSSMIRIL